MGTAQRRGGEGLVHRVAKRIAAARRAGGLTQEELATRLDIAVKNVQRIESGTQNLSLRTIERICSALDVVPETVLSSAKVSPPDAALAPPLLRRLEAAGYAVHAADEERSRPPSMVPVTTLRAAAGRAIGSARSIEVLGWVRLPSSGGLQSAKETFVAEIIGSSMEPRIPAGSIGVFRAPGPLSTLRGRTVLVSHPSLDDELLGPTAVKRLGSVRRLPRDGVRRVVLESYNSAYPPLVVDTRDDDELRVIAELVEVLAGSTPRRR